MSEIIIVDSEETAGKIYARFVADSIKKSPILFSDLLPVPAL